MPDEAQPTTKRCSKCGGKGPFVQGERRCKDCRREYNAAWYAANKDRHRKTGAAWNAANKDRRREYTAAWRAINKKQVRERYAAWVAANRERHRETAAAYYIANKERLREANIAWKAANPQRVRDYNAQDRERYPGRHRARHAVTNAIRDGRLTRGACEVCGLTPKKINGRERIQAHHHLGYEPEFWLDVQWLCRPHHAEADREATSEKKSAGSE